MNKREWALLALGLGLLAAVALRPSIRGNDGIGHYVYLASLLRGGDLDFTDDYARFDALRRYPYKFSELTRSPATGRPSNRYGIGAAALWSPFVLVAHGALRFAGISADPASGRAYEWAVGMATAFWASLALALLYARLRCGLPPQPAAAILAGLLFATPLGFYIYAHGSMSHGVSFFAATALLLAFERAWNAPSPRAFAWCGFWSAWLIMIRFQDATWVLVLGGALCFKALLEMRNAGSKSHRDFSLGMRNEENTVTQSYAKDRKDSQSEKNQNVSSFAPFVSLRLCAKRILAFSAAFLLVFSLQMAVWRVLYGSFLSGPMPYLDSSAGSFSLFPAHLLEALFSARHGVLAWHPLIALGLIGLVLMLRKPANSSSSPDSARPIAAFGLAGFAAQLYLVGCWSMWWAGASFGNRFFISSLPFVALGLARLVAPPSTRRRAFAYALLFSLILWNFGLLVQYATQMIPREDWVPWSRIIRQNLIDVPRYLLSRLTGR